MKKLALHYVLIQFHQPSTSGKADLNAAYIVIEQESKKPWCLKGLKSSNL